MAAVERYFSLQPNYPLILSLIVYAATGVGLLGGYPHWSIGAKFLYSLVYPVHWTLYMAWLGFERIPSSYKSQALGLVSLACKLFFFYCVYKWWIGDWFTFIVF